ncbi:hypothetical protein IC620_09290 [Hazenella sp. IB182357]|uniref:Uncharacterized protein n=1 Tax=Polycladospora coralii TaxID=2771432 RepID=A0A926N9X0_9BACL|nr:hypothetical protein [Polycladospora coralii]MBD1372547.1 hypothetical protein [Polycladospora coralii]MBS7531330.1 hypothetical protein [Polycladospora coralii]
MTKRYVPQIREAHIPEDGVWAEIDASPVLILSIPEWSAIINEHTKGFKYVWMFDRTEDGYIFCFHLESGIEKAIAFPKEHAGILLMNDYTNSSFAIIITDQELKDISDEATGLLLRDVYLKRHPHAGW